MHLFGSATMAFFVKLMLNILFDKPVLQELFKIYWWATK